MLRVNLYTPPPGESTILSTPFSRLAMPPGIQSALAGAARRRSSLAPKLACASRPERVGSSPSLCVQHRACSLLSLGSQPLFGARERTPSRLLLLSSFRFFSLLFSRGPHRAAPALSGLILLRVRVLRAAESAPAFPGAWASFFCAGGPTRDATLLILVAFFSPASHNGYVNFQRG